MSLLQTQPPSLHAVSSPFTFSERTGDDRGVSTGHGDLQSLFPLASSPLWLSLPLDRFTGSKFLTVSRYMYVVWGYMNSPEYRPTQSFVLVRTDTHESVISYRKGAFTSPLRLLHNWYIIYIVYSVYWCKCLY